MIKRKKDDGFTLIELMIVIAVIGILAIVLVPKVGTIKTQAKTAGVDTNMRLVEGYVQSRISHWADNNTSFLQKNIADDLKQGLTNSSDPITNPFTDGTTAYTAISDPIGTDKIVSAINDAVTIVNATTVVATTGISPEQGTIEVIVPDDVSLKNTVASKGIIINGLDKNGRIYNTATILP